MIAKTKITMAFLALALIPFAIFTAQPAVEQENDIALRALQLENEGKKQLESQLNGMQLNGMQGTEENLNKIKQVARKPKTSSVPPVKPQVVKPTPSVTATPNATITPSPTTTPTKTNPEFNEEAGDIGIQEFDDLNEINDFDWSFEDINFGE